MATRNPTDPNSFFPPLNFKFAVRFEGIVIENLPGAPDVGFQEVSGISTSVGEYPYKEGGENRFTHRLPDRVSYDKLSLKRGLLCDSRLITLFNLITDNYIFQTVDIMVMLLDGANNPLEAWRFEQAYPVKWSFDSLDAMSSKHFIESIDFSYQRFRRVGPQGLNPVIVTT